MLYCMASSSQMYKETQARFSTAEGIRFPFAPTFVMQLNKKNIGQQYRSCGWKGLDFQWKRGGQIPVCTGMHPISCMLVSISQMYRPTEWFALLHPFAYQHTTPHFLLVGFFYDIIVPCTIYVFLYRHWFRLQVFLKLSWVYSYQIVSISCNTQTIKFTSVILLLSFPLLVFISSNSMASSDWK